MTCRQHRNMPRAHNPEAPLDGLNDHWDLPPKHDGWWSLVIVFMAVVLAGLAVYSCSARARDLGQWKDSDPAISEWFRNLKQPDNPTISCCGEGDAYYADATEIKDGHTVAVITDERDDAPLGREHEVIGTHYRVPDTKIKWDKGNPTGHIILFLGGVSRQQDGSRAFPREVLCYVMNGGV